MTGLQKYPSNEPLGLKEPRLDGLDLARFIALAGMVVVNFSVVMLGKQDENPLWIGTLLQGRAAATFVVLAGVGLGLTFHLKAWGPTFSVVCKRALFLLVIGLLNAIIFPADIIHYYAFYLLAGGLLIRARAWVIGLMITMLMLGFVFLSDLIDYDTGWNWQTFEYNGFWEIKGFIRNLFYNGWHPIVPWMGFLLLGIWISRLQLSRKTIQVKLILVGSIVLVGVELGSHYLTKQLVFNSDAAFLFSTAPIPPMPLFILAGSGAACLIIGLCLYAAPALKSIGVLHIFTAPGRQSLTLYIAHIYLGMGTLEILGLVKAQSEQSVLIAVVIFCGFAIFYANIWRHYFKHGPLEALMRRLTR